MEYIFKCKMKPLTVEEIVELNSADYKAFFEHSSGCEFHSRLAKEYECRTVRFINGLFPDLDELFEVETETKPTIFDRLRDWLNSKKLRLVTVLTIPCLFVIFFTLIYQNIPNALQSSDKFLLQVAIETKNFPPLLNSPTKSHISLPASTNKIILLEKENAVVSVALPSVEIQANVNKRKDENTLSHPKPDLKKGKSKIQRKVLESQSGLKPELPLYGRSFVTLPSIKPGHTNLTPEQGDKSFDYETLNEKTGSLAGTIRDSSGVAINAASVKIEKNGVVTRMTTSNEDGVFSLPFLDPGQYTVSVAAPNFKRVVIETVLIENGQRKLLDSTLESASIVETVGIFDDPPLLDVQPGKLPILISTNQVNELPLNVHNFTQAIVKPPLSITLKLRRDPTFSISHKKIHGTEPIRCTLRMSGDRRREITVEADENNICSWNITSVKSFSIVVHRSGNRKKVIRYITKRVVKKDIVIREDQKWHHR